MIVRNNFMLHWRVLGWPYVPEHDRNNIPILTADPRRLSGKTFKTKIQVKGTAKASLSDFPNRFR